MPTKKQKGYAWEKLVQEYYERNGCEIITTNYTIRGGEIDIIAKKWTTTYFVEVKVVDYTDDLIGYVTPKKLHFLHRVIDEYCWKYKVKGKIQLDVVFVKNNKIIERFKNITNS